MKIAVAIAAVLALALDTAGTVFGVMEAGRASTQARQLLQEQTTIERLSSKLSGVRNQVSGLSDQVSSLNARTTHCRPIRMCAIKT